MSKVIDLKLDIPPTAAEMAEKMDFLIANKAGDGAANYRRIFGPRWATALGMSLEDLEQKREAMASKDFKALLTDLAEKITLTPDQFVEQLDAAGIAWGLIDDPDSDKTAAFIQRAPDDPSDKA